MNTSPASNPFTGLKGALAGLMSGGWVGLLLGLLFRRRIAPMLAALESLFAQWKAGTLPMPAVALPMPAAPAAGTRVAAPRVRQRRPGGALPAPRRLPEANGQPVARVAGRRVRGVAGDVPGEPPLPAPALYAPPLRRRARCSENAVGKVRRCMPKLLRFQNEKTAAGTA